VVPALIERARREIALARLVGKFTVDFGVDTLRKRLVDRVDPITSSAGGGTIEVLADAVDDDLVVVAPVRLDASADDAVDPVDDVDVDDLVLPDYDHLPAAHVVAKLASLTPAERDAVEAYELANRHRRTILGKIDQLRVAR
jgi:hypothetical protein